jgi:hypothetical protein
MSGYFQSPVRALLLLGFLVYLGYTGYRLIRRGTDDIILVAAVWLTVFSVFHVYFNPREALLYSCQALASFMLILARVFEDIRWRWKPLLIGLFAVGMAYVNLKCLQG